MSTTPSAGGGPGNLGLALIAIDTAQHASHADPAIGENVQRKALLGHWQPDGATERGCPRMGRQFPDQDRRVAASAAVQKEPLGG